jgi:hypothetical protein
MAGNAAVHDRPRQVAAVDVEEQPRGIGLGAWIERENRYHRTAVEADRP